MIRLSDSIGIGAFQVGSRAQDAGLPPPRQREADAFAADLLVLANGIGSDPEPASRGLSVAQHAANVLSHICRDGS